MPKTTEFTLAEREELSRLLSQGQTFTEIAILLGKHRTTLAREIGRKGMDRYTYRAHKTRWDYQRKKKKQGRKRKIDQNPELKQFIFNKLNLRWSPDQIAKELKRVYPDNESMHISPKAIYSYVYVLPRGSLKKELLSYLKAAKAIQAQKRQKSAQKQRETGSNTGNALLLRKGPKKWRIGLSPDIGKVT